MKNTLHRHVFRLLAENTSVLLRKQSVPQGDLHSAQKTPSTHAWEVLVPAGVLCCRVLAMRSGLWQVIGGRAHSSVFKMT